MSTEHSDSPEVTGIQIKLLTAKLAKVNSFILSVHTDGLQAASRVTDPGLGKRNEELNSGNRSVSVKERDYSRIIKGTIMRLT